MDQDIVERLPDNGHLMRVISEEIHSDRASLSRIASRVGDDGGLGYAMASGRKVFRAAYIEDAKNITADAPECSFSCSPAPLVALLSRAE